MLTNRKHQPSCNTQNCVRPAFFCRATFHYSSPSPSFAYPSSRGHYRSPATSPPLPAMELCFQHFLFSMRKYCTLSQGKPAGITIFHPVRLQLFQNDLAQNPKQLQALSNELEWSRSLKLVSVTMIN